ncbi:MAG: beta/gamma crystallin family protein [Acidobacteria bacterium]|nr:beta/gamma crystallin family protein [Acidobacteriota bacterium]MCW5950186.1 beta/gamma crystallin family protein [Pyrinomonadaceae bacterium]
MRNRSKNLITGTLALAFAMAFVATASAQDGRFFGGPGITVFTDKNFKGTTRNFQSQVPDLRTYGLDNKISSLRVGNGEMWEICADRNFGGGCAVVSGEEYDLSQNGWNDRISSLRRAGSGGGGGGNWSGATRPPSWAVGTFYGTAPNGSQIVLTISADGQVTANIGGSVNYGNYNRGNIYINGQASRVNQVNNGIQTVSTANGETITYSRNSWGGGGGGWGGGSRPPSWAVGTFYGTAPNGTQIVLTIEAGGNVQANVGGSTNFGTYSGGMININGNTSRVNQINNGIQTISTINGETINYSRNSWGGGGGGWGGANVPSWAIGSFRARNPQTGGTIFLTVNRDGSVTVNMDGSMSYGTLSGTQLSINGNTSTVSRRGNGIRTRSNYDGAIIDYVR